MTVKRNRNILITLLMLAILSGCGQGPPAFDPADYEHPSYTSTIAKEDCCLCGEDADLPLSAYWGQDNIGVINMNTFDVCPIDINTYGPDGRQIREAQGVALFGGVALGELLGSVWVDPDRGDAHISIPSGSGTIDPEAIGSYLCQDCLDDFSAQVFVRDTPSEIAVVNFKTRELRPLVETHPWFTFDNFSVDCDFLEDGGLSLLIYYAPPRFQETDQMPAA